MIGVIIVIIIICVFITLWIFIVLCEDAGTWIFNKDYYSNKVAILREVERLHKEVADLKKSDKRHGLF